MGCVLVGRVGQWVVSGRPGGLMSCILVILVGRCVVSC